MTDAVERVARALNPECFDAEVERVYGELWAFDSQAKARRQARAAILALREPTKEMVVAGDDEKEMCIDSDWSSDADGNRHDYMVINSDLAAHVWRAMIDAALGDPQ